MDAVINSFTLKEGTDWPTLAAQVDEFQQRLAGERPEFRGVSLVRVSDTQAILVVLFDDRKSLDDISRDIAVPWFAEHVRPHLAGPVNRQVGEIVAGRLE